MSLMELYKSFLEWSWSSWWHLLFFRYFVVSFSCEIFWMKITADVGKILKTVQGDLMFIFHKLSEHGINFVPNLIFSPVKNVSFTCNEFSRKRGCITMCNRNYAETFCLYKGCNIATADLTQISSSKN